MSAELKADGTIVLKMRRKLPFARDLVFDAWLKKEHLLQWMGPTPDITLGSIEVDAQVGGQYRFGFDEKGCADNTSYCHGEYLTIDKPEKIAFTWVWEDPLPEAGFVSLVSVEFTEVDGGTEIYLKQEKFIDEASCERHREGWSGTIDKLDDYLLNA